MKTRLLLTTDQAAEFDAERAAEAIRNRMIRQTEAIGLAESDFLRAEADLARESGFAPSPVDTFWGLANQQVQNAMLAQDWHEVSMVYWQMAIHLYEEGRDYQGLRHLSNDAKVMHYMSNQYWSNERVSVEASSCCDHCAALDGRVFSFEEALALSPLPPEDCTREWCHCGWSRVVE
jgi:hypothetical protein